MLLFSIVASILLGWPGAVISILMNTMALIGIGFLLRHGFWGELPVAGNSVTYWIQVALDIFFINVTATFFLTYLFFQLETSDRTTRATARLLEDERSKLQKALYLRKNRPGSPKRAGS